MDQIVKRTIRAKIYDFVTQRIVYHSVFWVVMFFILLLLDSNNHSFLTKFSVESVNVLFYGILVYFNLFYLIPNYLTEKKFLQYSFLLTLSVVVITPIKLMVFYLILSNAETFILGKQFLFFIFHFVYLSRVNFNYFR